MKYLSLFTGIGGFELGIQNAYENKVSFWNECEERDGTPSTSLAGAHPTIPSTRPCRDSRSSFKRRDTGQVLDSPICVGYSEIDKYATAIYQSHFPTHNNYGDITQINEREIPDFDLLVGGFPCQAFSIAGKRAGFADTRGTLFFDIARILKEKQPRLLLLENVKGLLSHDNGRTFKTIIATLTELGYDCQWQVLNSKNHGVPQNRERVFIVGHLRGTARPEVFPFRESNANNLIQLNDTSFSGKRLYDKKGLSPALNTMQGGNRRPFVVAQRGRYIDNPKSRVAGLPTTQMLEPNLNGVSNTLSTVQKDNMLCDSNSRIRRLTPTECERLQGFPDGWTKGVSDSQRYKCLGNAVTTNVIAAVIARMI